MTEYEKTLRSQGYSFEYKIQATEAKLWEEIVETNNQLDWKQENYKEYLENRINNVHQALKSQIITDEEKFNELVSRVADLEN